MVLSRSCFTSGRGTRHSYCLFFPLSSSRTAKPIESWEIVLGENLGEFEWEEEIWGRSCCLHPFKGVLWAEEQAYHIRLQRAKPGSMVEVTERQRSPPDLRSNFRSRIFWICPWASY